MEDAIEDAKWRAGLRYDEAAWMASHLIVAYLMAANGKTPPQAPRELLGRQPLDLDPRGVPEPVDEEAQEKAARASAMLEEHARRMGGEER